MSEVVCSYYNKGYCKFEEGCYFVHSKPICTIDQYRDISCKERHTKQCWYQDQCNKTTCPFSHKPPPEGRHSPPIHPSQERHRYLRYLRHSSPQLPASSILLHGEVAWGTTTSHPEQSPPDLKAGREGTSLPGPETPLADHGLHKGGLAGHCLPPGGCSLLQGDCCLLPGRPSSLVKHPLPIK